MSHHACSHVPDPSRGEAVLWWAVAANLGLTLLQAGAGIWAGSIALTADALHNFSDAGAIILALVALRIGKRPADSRHTFGYRRAENVAALMNLTALLLIGAYLLSEAVMHLLMPRPVSGEWMIGVAVIALAVDLLTAALTFRRARHSQNFRAVFIHNLADALGSVGVLISGLAVLYYDLFIVDSLIGMVIAAYVLWHAVSALPAVISLLMNRCPAHLDRAKIIDAMTEIAGVENVHHVHVWRIDEARASLEAHVRIRDLAAMEAAKQALKALLLKDFGICHATLEFETDKTCADACNT